MALNTTYAETEPAREDVDALPGPTVVEFGAPWCGFCIGAQALITDAFAGHPAVQHIKIEDGPGRRLGRSYRVKLWPTLVFLKDGVEVARLVRPNDAASIRQALAQIDSGAPTQAP